MGSLHLVGGEKGGVGKSFTSRLLAQYFIDSKKIFIGFDTDRSHGTFSRFYDEYTTKVDIEKPSSLDQIIESADNEQDANIVVDLAAQTSQKIHQWIGESSFFEIMQELGFKVYIWHVMDDGADSARLLESLIRTFPIEDSQLVAVRNYGRGKNFDLFEQSPMYTLAKKNRVILTSFARLEDDLTQRIDFGDMSFWAAANTKGVMKISERYRVKVWMNSCYKQISNVLNCTHNSLRFDPSQSVRNVELGCV